MKYNDEELYGLHSSLLDEIKTSVPFNEFVKWTIQWLKDRVHESTEAPDWFRGDIKSLRDYRTKSIRFYEKKLVKSKRGSLLCLNLQF